MMSMFAVSSMYFTMRNQHRNPIYYSPSMPYSWPALRISAVAFGYADPEIGCYDETYDMVVIRTNSIGIIPMFFAA